MRYKVTLAIQDGERQGKAVTQPAIAEIVQLSLSGMRYYPNVRGMLEVVASKNRTNNALAALERENELIAQVQIAVESIKRCNR